MRLAVTGATGYIGENLIAVIQKHGGNCLALSRKRPTNLTATWQEYQLQNIDITLPPDITCVVHLAMNVSLNSDEEQKNEILATEKLLAAAKKIGATFIYLSSQTASPTATTRYGQTKWEIEKMVAAAEEITMRPGMVYGGRKAGLYSQMAGLVKRLPCIPYFFPAPKVQPIHVYDLCEAIVSASQRKLSNKILCIAETQPIGFHQFLKVIAEENLRKRRLFLPIPSAIITFAYRIFSKSPTLIRLQSLFTLPNIETAQDLNLLGIKPRSFNSGNHPSGSNRRRLILLEAIAFYRYILRNSPHPLTLRRYLRVIEQLRDSKSLELPKLITKYPCLIALLERANRGKRELFFKEFQWRLNAATTLAEASPLGAERYLRLGKHNSFLMSSWICTKAIITELILRIAALAFSQLLLFLFVPKSIANEH